MTCLSHFQPKPNAASPKPPSVAVLRKAVEEEEEAASNPLCRRVPTHRTAPPASKRAAAAARPSPPPFLLHTNAPRARPLPSFSPDVAEVRPRCPRNLAPKPRARARKGGRRRSRWRRRRRRRGEVWVATCDLSQRRSSDDTTAAPLRIRGFPLLGSRIGVKVIAFLTLKHGLFRNVLFSFRLYSHKEMIYSSLALSTIAWFIIDLLRR